MNLFPVGQGDQFPPLNVILVHLKTHSKRFWILVNYVLRFVHRLVHHFLCWLILHLIINFYRIVLVAGNRMKTSNKTTLNVFVWTSRPSIWTKVVLSTRFYLNYNRSTEVLSFSTIVLLSKWFMENNQIDLMLSLLCLSESW